MAGTGTEIFTFLPDEYRDELLVKGYIHIPNGVAQGFIQYISDLLSRKNVGSNESLADWQIKNKKQQELLEFSDEEMYQTIIGTLASLIGADPENVTLAERHIKVYDENAEAYPDPHKDRLASEYAIGIPVISPDATRVIIYPEHSQEVNPLATSITSKDDRTDRGNIPDSLSLDIPHVSIDAKPGDLVMFRGSSMYHERLSAAGTTVLYLKINTLGLDPLGEDPKTQLSRDASLEFIKSNDTEKLLDVRVRVSPKVHKVSTGFTRLHWKEVSQLHIWGEKDVTLSETEQNLLLMIDGKVSVPVLLSKLNIPVSEYQRSLELIKGLIELGGLDICL